MRLATLAEGSRAAAKQLLTARGLLTVLAAWTLVSCAQSWRHSVTKWKAKNSFAAWYAPYDFIALDFLHNYQASRFWLAGHDPYREDFQDPTGRKLCYPPVVLACFAWCKLFPVQKAIAVWTAALAAFAGLGAVAAWRTRRELGSAPVPLLVAILAVVTSAPVAYAMERGNYDLLLVPLLLLMAWGLRRAGLLADGVVGCALGLAICLKVYPGLLLFALVALRRWRAVGLTAVAAAAFLLFQSDNLPIFVANLRELAGSMNEQTHRNLVLPATHSITYTWKPLWLDTKLAFLLKVPGSVAALGIVGSLLLWVCWHVRRCLDPRAVIVPLLLWIAAAATFVPRVSNDYNLFFLPMAALAVWDRRDAVAVHVAMGCLIVWAQPLAFGLSLSVLFGLKVASLVAVAASLVQRTRELSARTPTPAAVFSGTVTLAAPQPVPTTECCHVE